MSAALRSAVLRRLRWPPGRCRLAYGTSNGPKPSRGPRSSNADGTVRRRVHKFNKSRPEPLSTLSTNSIARAVSLAQQPRPGLPGSGRKSSGRDAQDVTGEQALVEALGQPPGPEKAAIEELPKKAAIEELGKIQTDLWRVRHALKLLGPKHNWDALHAKRDGPLKNLAFTLAWFQAAKGLYLPHKFFPTAPKRERIVAAFDDFISSLNKKLASAFNMDALPAETAARYRLKSILPENHTPDRFKAWPMMRVRFAVPLMRFKTETKGRGPTVADATEAAISGLHVRPEVRTLMMQVNDAQAVVYESPPPPALLKEVYAAALRAGCFAHIQIYQKFDGHVLRVTKIRCRVEKPTKVSIEAPKLKIKVVVDESIDKACHAFLEALASHTAQKAQTAASAAALQLGSINPDDALGILQLRYPGCVFSFEMPRVTHHRRMGVQVVQCTRNSIPFGPSVLVTLPPLGKWKKSSPAAQNIADYAAKLAYTAAAMYPFQGKPTLEISRFRDLDEPQLKKELSLEDDLARRGIDLAKPKVW